MIHWKDIDLSTYQFSFYKNAKLRHRNECADIFSFDIETTSIFEIDGVWQTWSNKYTEEEYNSARKTSFCYIWQFAINDDIRVYGRHLDEFIIFLTRLMDNVKSHISIWVHNLPYEFQYLRNIFPVMEVFARKRHKPMKATININDRQVMFKCSYVLTQLSLARLGELYAPPHIQKMIGDLDYYTLRTSSTPLTDDEMLYCENDVRVLFYAIKHYVDKYGSIGAIPMTHTGEVRQEMRKLYKGNRHYNIKCQRLVPYPTEFEHLNHCFRGGDVHATAIYTDVLLNDVASFDFASSYPFVMCVEKFPMSHFRKMPPRFNTWDLIKSRYKMEDNAFMLHVRFTNIDSVTMLHYLSYSKALSSYHAICDNGRVAKAERLEIWATEQDMAIIEGAYSWEHMEIIEAYRAIKDYLDINYVNLILDYFANKTSLKNVEGMEDIYADSKTYINGLYGMFVTSIVAPDVSYHEDWTVDELTPEAITSKLDKERHSWRCLTSYAWGVWVTAYARHNLWNVMLAIGNDVVYRDTDSVKYLNAHETVIDDYNKSVYDKIMQVCTIRNIDIERFMPCDPSGIKHCMGVMESEGVYDEFITQGAKKYCFVKNGELSLTLSGVNKRKALVNNSPLQRATDFRCGLIFDEFHSGRLLMQYEDEQPTVTINGDVITAKHGIVARPTTYKLGHSIEYDNYIFSVSNQHE